MTNNAGCSIKSIDGIILLHPISRNRMTENSVAVCTLREEFSKLLGVSLESRFPFYRVVLATTFWTNENVATGFEEVAEEDYTSQLKRERELQTDWWKLLEVQGAMFRRHDNTTECARDIVWSVLKVCRGYRQIATIRLPNGPSGASSRREDHSCTRPIDYCVRRLIGLFSSTLTNDYLVSLERHRQAKVL